MKVNGRRLKILDVMDEIIEINVGRSESKMGRSVG